MALSILHHWCLVAGNNHASMVSFAGACFAIGKRIWAVFVRGDAFWREESFESWFPVDDIGGCLIQFNRLLRFQ
jgi:hypothetical protein